MRHPEGILTKPKALLLAMLGVVQDSMKGLLLGDLVVHVWRAYPDLFGMTLSPGMDPHPDNNLVLTYLYGQRGLVARGLLRKDGAYFYFTDHGLKEAKKIRDGESAPGPVLAEVVFSTLDVKYQNRLVFLLRWAKDNPNPTAGTFSSSAAFLGIEGELAGLSQEENHLLCGESLMRAAEGEEDPIVLKKTRESYTLAEVRAARNLFNSLSVKYKNHLKVLFQKVKKDEPADGRAGRKHKGIWLNET